MRPLCPFVHKCLPRYCLFGSLHSILIFKEVTISEQIQINESGATEEETRVKWHEYTEAAGKEKVSDREDQQQAVKSFSRPDHKALQA